jgi:hypothetical protein
MVSVCAVCHGLQKHLHGLDGAQENGTDSLLWINTSLATLRTNSSCRACALLLNGILLHHDRFAGVNEDSVRVKAESFNKQQQHLSVELRWKDRTDDHDECQDDEHEHSAGSADLKLEFFTDGGMRQVPHISSC